MTSKKLLSSLVCAAALGVATVGFAPNVEAAANPFASVPVGDKAYDDVAALVDHGLIYGYSKGDFNKTRPISRMEMAIFAGKAMTAMDRAGAEDTQRINRLVKQFQDELTSLNVQVPGAKAKKPAKAPKMQDSRISKIPDKFNLNGIIRLRHDWGSGDYDGPKGKRSIQDFGGTANNQVFVQMNTKFGIGGGWSGEVQFFGAKDANGDSRNSGENTVGLWDFGRAYVTGPTLGGVVRAGRLKGSTVYSDSLIMGQYYQGIDYTKQFDKKWKASASWGKIDYATNQYVTESDGTASKTRTFRSDRGVSGSDMNPDGVGVSMWQMQTNYQASKNFALLGSWWYLYSRNNNEYSTYGTNGKKHNIKYPKTHMGEIGFKWDVSRKLTVLGKYAQSNRNDSEAYGGSGDNKAYALDFRWGQVNATKPHSSRFQLALIHQGRYTGIKSSYDLKNKQGEGQRGFIMGYRYVPFTNFMLDFRWMHYKAWTNGNKGNMNNANQYRVQLYYYF